MPSYDDDQETTDFGYQKVKRSEKAKRVEQVFDSVATRYDVMNDVMSLGIHRLWKHLAVDAARVRPGQKILDLAGGTGDLALKLTRLVGSTGTVFLSDINASMLNVGRDRLLDQGLCAQVRFVQADAQCLPFVENSFDLVTMAFGLRNVTDKACALRSVLRVLKPGGKLLVLEFSKPSSSALAKVYDWYSFKLLPRMGKIVAKDADSYQYLAESIRMHPDQETLQHMMETAGFARVNYRNMTGGIVALHSGIKS